MFPRSEFVTVRGVMIGAFPNKYANANAVCEIPFYFGDLGAPGNSLGDVYHFSAALHSERGGSVTGEVIGSKTLVKLPTDANPNQERRATLMFLTFTEGKDQIIAFGAADYASSTPEFDADKPVVRPVLGGTGKYMGARGQVTSMRSSDGSYTQVFTLLR
jgi:hypothetical protein